MKKLLSFTIASFCLVAANAQVKFGVKAGAGIVNQTRTDAEGWVPHTTSSKLGIHVGGFAELPVTDKIFLQPQLLLATKGATDQSTVSGEKTKASLTYIDLPIVAVYKHPVKFGNVFGGLGPVFSYAISGKLQRDGQTKNMFSEELKYWKRGDIGLHLTAGAELNKNIIVSISYQAGLMDIYKHEVVNLKNRSFGISVGYVLK